MKTVKDFCDALIGAFGEEHHLESLDSDKSEEILGDSWMGYFKVTTFKISIELKRVEKIGKNEKEQII